MTQQLRRLSVEGNSEKDISIMTTDMILNKFENFRMPPTPIDEYEKVGKSLLRDKIHSFVKDNQAIDFVMLGYPMKSPNSKEKVLGILPDMAEEVSFKNFTTFGNEIKSIYEPGANITLVSDGYVFSDVLGVSDRIVDIYGEAVRDMSKDSPVTWYNMKDFYSKKLSNSQMREKLTAQFGINDVELESRILMDPDVNFLYRGMIRFMEGDLAINNYPSGNQLHKAAKRVAREMMLRNESYSSLVKNEFKDSIRLSMHPSVNNGVKYSFQLIPQPLNWNKAWYSPWHSAIVMDGETPLTIHRKDAEAEGDILVYNSGQPYYFIPKR